MTRVFLPQISKNPNQIQQRFIHYRVWDSEDFALRRRILCFSISVAKVRNPELIRGVGKYSRSKMYRKRGLWAIKAKNGGAFPRHDKGPVESPAAEKPPKFYPADDVKKPLVNKHKPKQTKLMPSITPSTVLIILAGRFKGKRVVFLEQLPSGVAVEKIDDKYFGKQAEKKKKKTEGEFFESDKEEKNVISQEKKDD
nr:60S ribosomal protein L6-1-like [Ipomoea batatas]